MNIQVVEVESSGLGETRLVCPTSGSYDNNAVHMGYRL